MTEKKVITPEQMQKVAGMLRDIGKERDELLKTAAEASKKSRAEKIAFREVELGLVDAFKSYDEYQEKVAGLMAEDLDIVEKALERGYHAPRKDGELTGKSGTGTMDPLTRYILTGETELTD